MAGALLVMLGTVPCWAQSGDAVPHGPVHWLPDHDWSHQWCRYPGPKTKSTTSRIAQSASRVTIINEVEPNDLFANAQVISIAPGPMTPVDIDLKGTISIGADVDLFRFTATKGDVLGLAVISQSMLDPVLAVQQTNQVSLVENDNHNGLAYLYPPKSPMPGGVGLYDSALSWIAPRDGDYLIRVNSYASASRGDYTLQIRARRPSFENENTGETQIIFLDFDGATINAEQTFGGYGRSAATLSPLKDFLAGWGLSYEDEAEVVEAIVTSVQETFDNLRLASLNGNRDIDNTAGHFDVQILNSRDHADPWGQPNVSRVIVGGTIDQLSILTIGIAQSIDPGNFDRQETAVVLLDLLSLPSDDPWGVYNSINSIDVAAGLTVFDAIGQTVGNIVVHEAGHYLGNWHTDNENDVPCIMDTGGREIWWMAGAGGDAVLGTADDQVIEFLPDVFDPYEAVAIGEEETDVNSAFAMATGRVSRDTAPEPTEPTPPLVAVRASPTSGSPPLQVEFSAGGIDYVPEDLVFTWNFADGSDPVAGPVVSHEFTYPGDFLVKVTATNPQGAKGQASILISVSASLPTAVLSATPSRGPAPLTVTFDGQDSTAPAGNIVEYAWDLGDGTTATGAVVQHTYQNPGYYAAKLTITDEAGGKSSASTVLTVNSAVTSLDASQGTPSTAPAAPQCGLGTGVMMISSIGGLLGLAGLRRRR